MLQSLISLEDDQIDLVMDSVRQWCDHKHVGIDSAEASRAINVAVNIICGNPVSDLYTEMRLQLPAD